VFVERFDFRAAVGLFVVSWLVGGQIGAVRVQQGRAWCVAMLWDAVRRLSLFSLELLLLGVTLEPPCNDPDMVPWPCIVEVDAPKVRSRGS
jgi:hypothetical protein